MLLRQKYKGYATGLRSYVNIEPASEPITSSELKSYLKIDYTTEDTLIGDIITAARRLAENFTNRKFIETTITAYWNTYALEMWLPYPPQMSITHVKTKYQNTSTTLTADSDYYVLGVYDQMLLKLNQVLPDYSLEVKYVCGYGGAAQVPDDIRLAIMKIAANLYEYRQDFISGSAMANIPLDAMRLLSPYKCFYG